MTDSTVLKDLLRRGHYTKFIPNLPEAVEQTVRILVEREGRSDEEAGAAAMSFARAQVQGIRLTDNETRDAIYFGRVLVSLLSH